MKILAYISAPEAAKKRGISERRVQKLCEQNRIPGVTKFSRLWLIPKDALAHMGEIQPDLAILDIMMPEINGFTLCQKIRERYNFPIIMLTAKEEETDKLTGLTLGADDYITKPFRPLELVARVKAQLRRYKRYNPSISDETRTDIISHADILLNIKTHECYLNYKPEKMINEFFEIARYRLRQIQLNKENIDLCYMLVQLTDELLPVLNKSGNTEVIQIERDDNRKGDCYFTWRYDPCKE